MECVRVVVSRVMGFRWCWLWSVWGFEFCELKSHKIFFGLSLGSHLGLSRNSHHGPLHT